MKECDNELWDNENHSIISSLTHSPINSKTDERKGNTCKN